MAGQKTFPYRAAVVSCNGECPASAGFQCKYGCVGCGRCLSKCPISMNIVKVMKALGGKENE